MYQCKCHISKKSQQLLTFPKAPIGAILLLAIATSPALAQFRTSIQGVVTDPTGAVIPGATVTLKNLSTNQTLTRTSGPDGVYNFNALPADPFVLTAQKERFQKKVLDHLQLTPSSPTGSTFSWSLAAHRQRLQSTGIRSRPSTPKRPTLPPPYLRTRFSIFRYTSAIRPASYGWCPESRLMERSRVAAEGSRLQCEP